MQMSRFILVLALVGCDKSAEKVAALEEKIGGLEEKAKAAEELAETNEKLEKRVGELEKRAASIETDATAAAELQTADEKRINALQLELDELKLKMAKAIEAASKTEPTPTPTPETTGGSGTETEEKVEITKVGVPACDEYLAAYTKCIMAKMPASVRKSTLDAMAKSAEAFKKVASNPAARESLEKTCQSAKEAAAKSMKAFGCKM